MSITFDTGERLQSIEARGEIPGQNQRVSALSNLACFLAPHDRLVIGLLEAAQPTANGNSRFSVAMGEFDRAVLQETAFRAGTVDHAFERPRDRGERRALGRTAKERVNDMIRVVVECLEQEIAFAAKHSIKTALSDSHRQQKVVEGCRLVPLAPEQVRAAINGSGQVELSWS